MNWNLARLGFAFLTAAIGVTAFAQWEGPGKYREVRGVREFSGELIVRPLQPNDVGRANLTPAARVQAEARTRNRLQGRTVEYVRATDEYIVKIPAGSNENQYSLQLMKTGDYQYAEPNWTCYPINIPNDALYGSEWHHPIVKSPQAWDLMIGKPSIICAVVDTGIDMTHEDLTPNRVKGYNSADRLPEILGGKVNDLNGHGTHVAGDAAAIGNNGVGVSGMGWNFKIMPIRTSNSPGGGASLDDILAGARWAAENGARSVSASYSGVGAAAIGTTGSYIKTKNALFCYAAGNDNRNLSGFHYRDTIVVGASNEQDGKAGFSAYGRGITVFAPGTNIMSTTLGGGYGPASGTSMSTPVCNGAIALIFATNPGLTPDQAQEVLESQCDNIGPSTTFGKGRINQFKNVKRALVLLEKFVAPNAIKTLQGTYVSGSLSDVLAPNSGKSYWVNSVKVTGLGEAAGVEFSFKLPTSSTQVLNLRPTFQAAGLVGNNVTGFFYLWNYQTGKYDNIAQMPAPTFLSAIQSKQLSVNAPAYVGANGEVKSIYRAVSTTSGGGVTPFQFQLHIGYTTMGYSANP